MMKKVNRIVLGVAVALGLSAAAFVGAQQGTAAQANNANANYFECPYYNAGVPERGNARGMGGCIMQQGMGPGMRGQGMRGQGMRGQGMRGQGMRGQGMRGQGMRGQGMGLGMRGGFGSYLPRDYVVSLVTPAEMQNYRSELGAATSVEACQKVDAAHRQLVEERAAAMKVTAPQPRVDVCGEMENNGWFSQQTR